MTSSSGAIDPEEIPGLLKRANLPESVRRLNQKDFATKGARFLAYLNSGAYAKDYEDGKGVNLTGNAAVRTDLLALFAKTYALGRRATWYCSLHYLVTALDFGTDDDRAKLMRTKFLFVDWFEKDFGSDACPYTPLQRTIVEEFLATRSRNGTVTHFSSCAEWDKLRWWSSDFRGLLKDKIVDIRV